MFNLKAKSLGQSVSGRLGTFALVEEQEQELIESIKIANRIHADEVQRISLIKKIAQAQVDKLEMMKDLATYEVEFANQHDFSDKI